MGSRGFQTVKFSGAESEVSKLRSKAVEWQFCTNKTFALLKSKNQQIELASTKLDSLGGPP